METARENIRNGDKLVLRDGAVCFKSEDILLVADDFVSGLYLEYTESLSSRKGRCYDVMSAYRAVGIGSVLAGSQISNIWRKIWEREEDDYTEGEE